jgi:hypothetical protein
VSKTKSASLIRIVTRWVDKVLDEEGWLLPGDLGWVGGLPIMVLMTVEVALGVSVHKVIWIVAILIAASMTCFWLWRFGFQLKRVSDANAEHFDRVGKFELPPENADSESALKSARRRKNGETPDQ